MSEKVMASDRRRRFLDLVVSKRRIEIEQEPEYEEAWVKKENGRWKKEWKKTNLGPVTEDDASYWDLLPPELHQKILEDREWTYEVDRGNLWKPIHKEMSLLPRCSQHGTVRCFCFSDVEPDWLDFIFDVFLMTATYIGESTIVLECGLCRLDRLNLFSPQGSRVRRCRHCLYGVMNCLGYRYCTGVYCRGTDAFVICRQCRVPVYRRGLLCMPFQAYCLCRF